MVGGWLPLFREIQFQNFPWRSATALLMLLMTSAIIGCSPPPEPKADLTSQKNMVAIAIAYAQALGALQRPPNNVEDLLPILKQNQVNPADVLKSPNDGEDYVIIWGVDVNKLASAQQNPRVVLVYEKSGKGGVRNVLIAPSQVNVMTAEEFAKAPFPPGYQPK